MKVDKYLIKAEGNFTVFEFISEGPKGAIRKMVQFQKTNETNLYNLAFGDKNVGLSDNFCGHYIVTQRFTEKDRVSQRKIPIYFVKPQR